MSEQINHWCVVCGKGYHACDSCSKTKTYAPWRTLTDSIEHFKIFTVLRDYNNGMINKGEAKRLLSKLDLSEKESFKESAKKVLNDILAEDAVEHKTPRKKVNFAKTDVCLDTTKVSDTSTTTHDTEELNYE